MKKVKFSMITTKGELFLFEESQLLRAMRTSGDLSIIPTKIIPDQNSPFFQGELADYEFGPKLFDTEIEVKGERNIAKAFIEIGRLTNYQKLMV